MHKFETDSKPDQIFSLTSMFNHSLNDVVTQRGQNILTVMSCNTLDHSTKRGDLSPSGAEQFWLEVNDLMARFDADQVKLVPNQCRATHRPDTYNRSPLMVRRFS